MGDFLSTWLNSILLRWLSKYKIVYCSWLVLSGFFRELGQIGQIILTWKKLFEWVISYKYLIKFNFIEVTFEIKKYVLFIDYFYLTFSENYYFDY